MKYKLRFKKILKSIAVRSGYYSRPSFLICGAQKSGTTALAKFLRQHDQIVPAVRKEVRYFHDDSLYFLRGHYYYHINFPYPHQLIHRKLTFDATPEYLYHPECAKRIFDYRPDMKIIILLRNPVDRAYSAWNHYRSYDPGHKWYQLAEFRTFEQAIKNELENIEAVNFYRDRFGYIKRGLYAEQIERFSEKFPKEQLLIIENGEFKKDSKQWFQKVSRFLNINDDLSNQKIVFEKNVRSKKYENPLPEDLRKELSFFFKPYNERLFELIGNSYNWE